MFWPLSEFKASVKRGNAHSYCIIRPSITERKRIGFFVSDQACQTDESEIIQLKTVTDNIDMLLQVSLC